MGRAGDERDRRRGRRDAGRRARARCPPGLAADFIADGVVAGVGSVIVFLPQILVLFTVLYLLEDVGYMARAAFVVDRAMGRIGLEGRAFVALLSSYACAVPGIMATRTIPSPREPSRHDPRRAAHDVLGAAAGVRAADRRLRAGARRSAGSGSRASCCSASTSSAASPRVAAAAILKRTIGRGEALPFYLELPPYRIPPPRLVAYQVWGAARAFLRRAGTIILARLDRALGDARVPAAPGGAGRVARGGGPRAGRAELRRADRPRDRAGHRAARLRLEDRRRPRREPGRARGDRRDARADLRRLRLRRAARSATPCAPTSTRAPAAPSSRPRRSPRSSSSSSSRSSARRPSP